MVRTAVSFGYPRQDAAPAKGGQGRKPLDTLVHEEHYYAYPGARHLSGSLKNVARNPILDQVPRRCAWRIKNSV